MNLISDAFRALFEPSTNHTGLRYAVVRSPGGSSYGIPLGRPEAGSVGMRFFNAGNRSRRLRAASWGIAHGGARILPGQKLIVGQPRDIPSIFGPDRDRPAPIVLRFGTNRVNQKPVVATVEDGSVVRITKMGISPLTDALVCSEFSTLRELGPLDRQELILPQAIEMGALAGHPALVQTALPLDCGSDVDDEQRRRAAAAIARLSPAGDYPLDGSPWTQRIFGVLGSLPPSANRDALLREADRLVVKLGNVHLQHGSWHGDFTRWNTAVVGGQVAVWDWERFEESTPIGFDLLHWDFQARFAAGRDSALAATQLIAEAPHLLRPEAEDPESARAIAVGYLLAIAARYCTEGADATSALTRVDKWLLPALSAHEW